MMTRTNQSVALRAHKLSPPLITESSTYRPSISKPKSPRGPGSAHLRTSPAEGVGGQHHMSEAHAPPLAPPPAPLYKQRSWSPDSPDTYRDEAWQRRKGNNTRRSRRRSKSVTDEDLDELKACIELGFGFDSPDMDQRLSDTLPALGLYKAVNKQYFDTVAKSLSPSSSTMSECDPPSPLGSPHTIFGPGNFLSRFSSLNPLRRSSPSVYTIIILLSTCVCFWGVCRCRHGFLNVRNKFLLRKLVRKKESNL